MSTRPRLLLLLAKDGVDCARRTAMQSSAAVDLDWLEEKGRKRSNRLRLSTSLRFCAGERRCGMVVGDA